MIDWDRVGQISSIKNAYSVWKSTEINIKFGIFDYQTKIPQYLIASMTFEPLFEYVLLKDVWINDGYDEESILCELLLFVNKIEGYSIKFDENSSKEIKLLVEYFRSVPKILVNGNSIEIEDNDNSFLYNEYIMGSYRGPFCPCPNFIGNFR